jgi:hypothetical protein
MKGKSNLTIKLLVFIIALSVFAITATAQKKKVATKRVTTPTVTNALEIKGGAEKVSIQIKNVSKFIYLLGGVAKGIEDIDKDAKAGKVSKTIIDKNVEFKQRVIQGIQNLRAGLVALEIEFRTKPALRNYLYQIQGVSDLAGNSENLATNGQFAESGKVLLTVIEKLSDTLVAMP